MVTGARQIARWCIFFALWLVLVGTVAPLELLAGAVAALLATVAAGATSRLRLPSPASARSWSAGAGAAARIVPDTALVLAALVRRRRGEFAREPLPRGADWRRASERGAFVFASSLAPNRIALDVDLDRREALVHRLVRRQEDRR